MNAIREAGQNGIVMRDLYRKLNLSAKQARRLAQDLIRAGLIEEQRIERAEAYSPLSFWWKPDLLTTLTELTHDNTDKLSSVSVCQYD